MVSYFSSSSSMLAAVAKCIQFTMHESRSVQCLHACFADSSAGIHFVTTETDPRKLPQILIKTLSRKACNSVIVNWSWLEDCLDTMILLDTAPYKLQRHMSSPLSGLASTMLNARVRTPSGGESSYTGETSRGMSSEESAVTSSVSGSSLGSAVTVTFQSPAGVKTEHPPIPRFPLFSTGALPVFVPVK
jgi:hypothetical protein